MTQPPAHRPHALYRFHDADGALLYVGITLNPSSRWRDHSHDKPWWHEVAKITIEQHPNRDAVLEAERQAIVTEHPRHNIVHNRGHQPTPAAVSEDTSERIWQPIDMPDECHDRCVPNGIEAIYLPYKWRRDGRAWYQCAAGHRWQCSWGHEQSGEAPEFRGVPVEVLS